MDQGLGKSQQGPRDLADLVDRVREQVDLVRGDAIGLLDLLRLLERLHREVTEGAFQEALPQNRQELYKLLRVMEEEGGWPHISRLKLQMVCAQLKQEMETDVSHLPEAQ